MITRSVSSVVGPGDLVTVWSEQTIYFYSLIFGIWFDWAEFVVFLSAEFFYLSLASVFQFFSLRLNKNPVQAETCSCLYCKPLKFKLYLNILISTLIIHPLLLIITVFAITINSCWMNIYNLRSFFDINGLGSSLIHDKFYLTTLHQRYVIPIDEVCSSFLFIYI